MIKIPKLEELKEVPKNTTYTNDLFLPNEVIKDIYAKGKVKTRKEKLSKFLQLSILERECICILLLKRISLKTV